MRVEFELRHFPRFMVVDWLVQVGGCETEALCVSGDGWIAYLEALEPEMVGIVEVDRDRLVIDGDAHEVERVRAFVAGCIARGRRR